MLALLNRLRGRMSAPERSRAPAPGPHCVTAPMNTAVALHETAIEQDALAWAYRTLAQQDTVELAEIVPIEALLTRLAPQQLLIVDAWFRRELTCAEIAAAQGISREEARVRVHEVLKILRDADS